jgi:hypothetical protein
MMTPQEFADKMRALSVRSQSGALNRTHLEADELMCEILREWGFNEGVDIFEEMDKWYA